MFRPTKFQITIEIEDDVYEQAENNQITMEVEQPEQQLHHVPQSQPPKQTSPFQVSSEIVSDIISDVNQAYTRPQRSHQSTSQLVMNSSNNKPIHSIIEFAHSSGMKTIRELTFKHYFTQQETKLTHLQVLQQVVPNLCGYHASHNMLLMLDALKSPSHSACQQILQEIPSNAAFWKFHKDTTDFLWQYKLRYKNDTDKFPWNEDDIRKGDFERSYLKTCLTSNQRFIDALTSTSNNKSSKTITPVHIEYATWEYQFGRNVQTEASRNDFHNKIEAFLNFKKKDERFILAMMLGVTNHWASLVAIKLNGNVEFVFLDSRNRDYLEWNQADTVKWIGEQEKRRQEMQLKPWTDFDRLVQKQCVADIQESLSDICNCLLGNMTLQDCQINSQFLAFEKEFQAAVSYEQIEAGQNLRQQVSQTEVYAKDFYHSIHGFFKVKNALKHLTQTNVQRYSQFKVVFAAIHAANRSINPSSYHRSYIEPLFNLLERAKL